MVLTAMTGFCGICCLAIWVPANNYAVLLVFALLSGTATGTFWGTVVPVTAEVVGLQRLPSAFGMLCLPLMIPTVFAEPIALQLVSTSGYLSAKVFVGFMFLAGAASTWALRSWKICDIEDKERRERSVDESTYVKEKLWLTPRRLFMNKRI
jgi:predicted MFS family arabinose efflux permease